MIIIMTQTELLISKDEFLKFHLVGKTRSITWKHSNFFDLAENNPYALGLVENLINPGASALRNTGGARCWQQLPFSTFKLNFERHRSDSDKHFFSKIAGTVF